MNPMEVSECLNLLASLFPESGLTESEIELFGNELNKFDRDAVTDAIRNHRLTSRFNRPQFPQIFAASREGTRKKQGDKSAESMYRTAIARAVVAMHPKMNGRREAEIILRNQRFFMRYRFKDPVTGEMTFWPEDQLPMDRLFRLTAECVMYLKQAGWEDAPAKDAADWITAPLPDFEAWCRNSGQVNTRETPVPEFA